LSSCPTNPQGYIALCNLRLIQQRHAEARAALQQALSLFEASSLASVAAGGEEEEDQDIMGSFELRLEAAKMCLECALYEQCATIAERLLQVNDTELQLWYLAGMAYARQAPPQPEEAVEYLSYTLKVLTPLSVVACAITMLLALMLVLLCG
jgi:tetratricopeptide (TPR) repeat protein